MYNVIPYKTFDGNFSKTINTDVFGKVICDIDKKINKIKPTENMNNK